MTTIRAIFFLCLLSLSVTSRAQNVFKAKDVFIDLKSGSVELTDESGKKRKVHRESESAEYFPVRLRPGETIQTGGEADCNLVLPDAGTARLDPESRVKISSDNGEPEKKSSSLELLSGKLFLSIDSAAMAEKKKQFRLKTPTTILAVKGTQFFADAQNEVETSGVHKGKVVIAELVSGDFLTLDGGNAVLAKPGALANPRRLTAEESELAEIYDTFELEFIPGERRGRKFETGYEAQDDPNTAVPTDYPKLIEAAKSEELEGTAVKITIQPFPGEKTVSVSAKTIFEVPVRLRSAPKAIYFLAKADGVRGFQLSGVLEADKKKYSPVLPDGNVIQFPSGTKPGEWVPFLVPLEETEYSQNLGMITLSVNPNLTEDRAVESIISVDKNKPEYCLEISPLMIGVAPK